MKIKLLLACVVAFGATGVANADEFSKEDLARWQEQFDGVVKEGRALWTDSKLGKPCYRIRTDQRFMYWLDLPRHTAFFGQGIDVEPLGPVGARNGVGIERIRAHRLGLSAALGGGAVLTL